MYKQSLEDSRNALGTLLTLQDIYMQSTTAHVQQMRTAFEGIYDSLLNSEDINKVIDGFTNVATGIEVVVDGLGGLKGALDVVTPLLLNAFSSNFGQIFSLGFANFTVKEENTLKIQQLTSSISALRDVAPEVTLKYLTMKETLKDVSSNMKPELFNRISKSIEELAITEAKIADVGKKITTNADEIKRLKELSVDISKKQEDREININTLKEKQLKLTLQLNAANVKNAGEARKLLDNLNSGKEISADELKKRGSSNELTKNKRKKITVRA